MTVRAVATARQGQSTSVRDLQGNAPHMANVQGTFGRGNQDSRLSELKIENTFKDQGLSIKAGRLVWVWTLMSWLVILPVQHSALHRWVNGRVISG